VAHGMKTARNGAAAMRSGPDAKVRVRPAERDNRAPRLQLAVEARACAAWQRIAMRPRVLSRE